MNAYLTRLNAKLSTQITRIPILISLASLVASWLVINLDRLLQLIWPALGAPSRSDPQTARTLLALLALLMILAVLFGLLAAGLSLEAATRRFGRRAVSAGNYNRRLVWSVSAPLGVSVFSLYTLSVVRGAGDSVFVPHLAIGLALLAGVAALAVIMWAMRAWQTALEPPQVLARLAQAIFSRLEQEISPGKAPAGVSLAPKDLSLQTALPVRSGQAGYVQRIDHQTLYQLAERHDLVLRLRFRPGDFVLPEEILGTASPAARLDSRLALLIRQAFWVGPDPEAADSLVGLIENLAQIGVQSLSPDCADTLLARQCIDWLGAVLERLAAGGFPSNPQPVMQGHTRVIFERSPDFTTAAAAAFDELRQAIGHHAFLYTHLLATLKRIMQHAVTPDTQEALLQQAILVRRVAHAALQERHEREAIESQFALVMQAQRENR